MVIWLAAVADVRAQIVQWARWGPPNHDGFTYDEVRPMPSINNKPGELPWTGDCSSWVTTCYKWAGCPDPNGEGYDGEGYTGTLLSRGKRLAVEAVLPGDVVVYGAGTGVHTAVIVEGGANPLTSSMGRPGDPELVTVLDTIPATSSVVTYLRFAIPTGPAHPTGPPTRPGGPLPVLYWHVSNPPWVSFLHRCLQMPLPRRGGFGWSTFHRVVKFQTANHLPATGVVDAGTWQALGER